MRELAKITEGIIGQGTFTIFKKVNEMERSGRKFYHFELGDSDFSPIYTSTRLLFSVLVLLR